MKQNSRKGVMLFGVVIAAIAAVWVFMSFGLKRPDQNYEDSSSTRLEASPQNDQSPATSKAATEPKRALQSEKRIPVAALESTSPPPDVTYRRPLRLKPLTLGEVPERLPPIQPDDPPSMVTRQYWAHARQHSDLDELRLQLSKSQTTHLTSADLPALEEQAIAGDGEAAYLLFRRYVTCEFASKTDEELARKVDFWLDQGNSGFAEMAVSDYENCQDLREEPAALAIRWLTIAAELDYLIAQLDYAFHTRQIFSTEFLLTYPSFASEYRLNVLRFSKRAIRSGHPQAFLTLGKLFLDGTVDEKSEFNAFAMGYAAHLAGMKDNYIMASARSALGLSEFRRARREGTELCKRYCSND